jgi:hypothetical protein
VMVEVVDSNNRVALLVMFSSFFDVTKANINIR